MKKIIIALICFLSVQQMQAQQLFINKAVVEYEVKINIKKTMGSGSWAEMLKENMPQFKTGYFQYTFADNKSIYKFDHWGPEKMPEWFRKNDEENVWYVDHNTGRMNVHKIVYGSDFYVEDSIPQIEWRLTNENRVIAGFNCRKAIGKILDSVYVFAFYTDEITISGGPCSITGLPGMILGVTIPRLYASWIATKVMLNGVNESSIKPTTTKKPYSFKSLSAVLKDRTKEWVSEDDPESKKWIEQLYWNTML